MCSRHLYRWKANGDPLVSRTAVTVGPLDVDDAFGYWFAGLSDGESYFRLVTRGPDGMVMAMFGIQLRADDNAILEECRDRLGIGSISYRHGRASTGWNPGVVWEVRHNAGCERLVEVFDRYPLHTKKARDFLLWRRAVLLRRDRPTYRDLGVKADLTALASKLASGRKYAGAR